MNRPKWQAIGILLGVYALGVVTGGGALLAWHGKQRRDMAELGFGPHGERPVLALMRRLDLSREQRQAIERILANHAPKRRAIMQDVMSKCGHELDQDKADLDRQIGAILNPAQRAMFDELSQHQRERMFGHAGPRPDHGQ